LCVERNQCLLPGILKVLPVGIKTSADPAEEILPMPHIKFVYHFMLSRPKYPDDILRIE
jgi:hypothetical protein